MASRRLPQNTEFLKFLKDRYPVIKSLHPDEGRRKLHLRVLEEFWTEKKADSSPSTPQAVLDRRHASLGPELDPDPLDSLVEEAPEAGLLLRTDYSNQAAWDEFCLRLDASEREFAALMKQDDDHEDDTHDSTKETIGASAKQADAEEDVAMDDGEGDGSDSDSEDESIDEIPYPIIKIIDPDSPQDRAKLIGMSNLAALRMFNNVDIRKAPQPPHGTNRITPRNRLVDRRGWQEIYSGLNIWIYDSRSNRDQTLKQVAQAGSSVYGTATGDSWRLTIPHVPELQFKLRYLGVKIDFSGIDGWDPTERQRNMEEAELPIV